MQFLRKVNIKMNERRIIEKSEFYTIVEEKYTIMKKLCNECGLYVNLKHDDTVPHECGTRKEILRYKEPVLMFKVNTGTITRQTVKPEDIDLYKENGWKFLKDLPDHIQGKCY